MVIKCETVSLLLSSLLGLAQPQAQEERDAGGGGRTRGHAELARCPRSRRAGQTPLRQNEPRESGGLDSDFAWLSYSSAVAILDMDFQSSAEQVLRKRWPLGQAVAFPRRRPMTDNRNESGSRGACCVPGTVLGTAHACLSQSSSQPYEPGFMTSVFFRCRPRRH